MNQSEYFKKSDDLGLPKRCPLLNICGRRAFTIYLFNHEMFGSDDFIHELKRHGMLPDSFEKVMIPMQGESASMIGGNTNFHFNNVCPEVNLFDDVNRISGIKKLAASSFAYDKFWDNQKYRILEMKHFSECAEYSYNEYNQRNRKSTSKSRKRVPEKTRALLQKEIGSTCPFQDCNNEDIQHFDVHHIDEDPSNNAIENLLMLCKNCHSKITKNDISVEEVIALKKKLSSKEQIECASISIDSDNCSWEYYDDTPNAFVDKDSEKSPFPIFNFSLINHSSKTVLLKEIELRAKYLPSGLSGLPFAYPLQSIDTFKLAIPDKDKKSVFKLKNEIAVSSGAAFKFQVIVYSGRSGETYPIYGRNVLFFTFKFSGDIVSIAPKIYLNCKDENEGIQIQVLN